MFIEVASSQQRVVSSGRAMNDYAGLAISTRYSLPNARQVLICGSNHRALLLRTNMTPYVLLAVFAVAWFIANEKTNSKAAIYILFLGGLFALVVFWMSTLTGGAELLKLAGATAATIIFGVFGSTIAAMKI
jgi:hypothetical protein